MGPLDALRGHNVYVNGTPLPDQKALEFVGDTVSGLNVDSEGKTQIAFSAATLPGVVGGGTVDDSVGLQNLFNSRVFTNLPDGAKTYKASELQLNGLSVSASGSTFLQTAANAKVFKWSGNWVPNRSSLLRDAIIKGNGFAGGYGLFSQGETNLEWDNITIEDIEHPIRLQGDIYFSGHGLRVKGSGASAVYLSNIDPDGGLIAGDFQNSHFEQGSGVGLLITDVSSAQGFGALTFRNTTWQGYQRCAHVITAGEWRFEGYTQSEISALATSGWPYTTESAAHTVPERCVYYVGSGGAASPPGASVHYENLIVLPPPGAIGLLVDGSAYKVTVENWRGLASAKCINGGSIKVTGQIDIANQDARSLDLTSAIPGDYQAISGGFSCWDMKPHVRQNQNLRNAYVLESSGNPWNIGFDITGVTSPPTITTQSDPLYDSVTRLVFQAMVGVATAGSETNIAYAPVFANTNASGEYYGISFLIRKISGGTSTIYCGCTIGASDMGAHVVPTSSLTRVVMMGRYISSYTDGRFFVFPQDTAGAGVEIFGLTSIRGTHPDDMIPVLQGEVSAR